jgi:hypothetical protein
VLIGRLKHTLDYDRYPLAPHLDPLKAILAKLEPPSAEPLRPLPSGGTMTRCGRRRAAFDLCASCYAGKAIKKARPPT